jgi:phage shock protein PspC (stress-responsive transcriptional regulator)
MGQYCTCPNLKSKLRQKPYRNSKEWVIAGVCAWLADYFQIDVIWFRIFFLFSLFFFGTGVILYVVLAIILPEKSTISDPSWVSSYEKER